MKNIARIFALVLALVGVPAFAGTLSAETPLSSGAIGSQFPEIAYHNNVIHVVWVGYAAGLRGDIFYAQSTNAGSTFSAPMNLTSGTPQAATPGSGNDRPFVTAGPNGVYVGWSTDTASVFVRRSVNNGGSFGTSVPIAQPGAPYYAGLTSLFTDSAGRVHAAYYTNADTGGAAGMIHHRMTCDGATWGTDVAVTSKNVDGDVDNEEPRLAEAGGKIHVVFKSSRNGNPQGGWEPYSMHMQAGTVNAGPCSTTWSYPARRVAGGIPFTFASIFRPEIFGDTSNVLHLAWWDQTRGANVAYRKGSGLLGASSIISNFGVDHLQPGGISSSPGVSYGGFQAPPAIVSNGATAVMGYQKQTTVTSVTFENGPLYLRESGDNGTTWGAEQLIATTSQGTTPRFAIGGAGNQNVAIAWSDIRSGTARIYFRLYSASFNANVNALITSFYQTILGRAPDAPGQAFWAGEAMRVTGLGVDVREVFFAMSVQFFTSAEYLARNTNDTQYLTDLYNTFFNRPPDGAGLAFWQAQLSGGMDRGAMLNNFLFSAEFSNQMNSLFGTASVRPEYDMTIDLYRGILGALPDSAGFNFWLGQIKQAQCQGAATVSAAVNSLSIQFVQSPQFANKDAARPAGIRNAAYVGDLYNAFLRRGGDLAGYLFWVNQINSAAMTRDQVRAAFVASPEFQARVNAVIAAGCSPLP